MEVGLRQSDGKWSHDLETCRRMPGQLAEWRLSGAEVCLVKSCFVTSFEPTESRGTG